jgi:Arc/MetJ-type ribon-helix-helix transcriptional regulator
MPLTITLSPAASKIVQSRIEDGAYVNADAVIEAALLESEGAEVDIEAWLQGDVRTTYEDWKVDPTRVVASDEARTQLKAYMANRAAKTA